MSKGKADALEAAEAARDGGKKGVKSFSGGLFTGEANYNLIYPFPKQKEEDKAKGDIFLTELSEVLEKYVDADAIDREGEIPDEVFDMENLESLSFFQTDLTKLSENVGKLSNLKTLILSNNKLENLPESIGKCNNLEGIDVSDNPIKTLPDSLLHMNNLKYFSLDIGYASSLEDDEFKKISRFYF